jgi:hypothetical protein
MIGVLAVFQALRRRQNEAQAFLYAFDLLELDGTDLRREPLEVRKATLASILRKSRLNEHLEFDSGPVGSSRSGWARGAPPSPQSMSGPGFDLRHERNSFFLRKFFPAHSHHNASASCHESVATRMQMFAPGSKLHGRKPPAAEDAHRANRDISRVASPAWRPTETPRRSRQQPRDLETPPNGRTSEK